MLPVSKYAFFIMNYYMNTYTGAQLIKSITEREEQCADYLKLAEYSKVMEYTALQ
jgi:hypothetical protein